MIDARKRHLAISRPGGKNRRWAPAGRGLSATEDSARRNALGGALRRAATCAALGLVLLAIGSARAEAAYDPIGSGQTTLRLAAPFAKALRTHGVHLQGKAGVTVKGAAISFPVLGGKLEPVEAKGIVEHPGSLIFKAGGRSLPLRSLQLKSTRRTAPYAAKLGGGQLKLATTHSLSEERVGFGTSFRAPNLLLTANAATRLDKKLGLPGVFAAGQKLGTATTTVEPASVAIKPGGVAELSIDPGFAAKLQSFFVAVNPIAPAEHPGAFTFPIGGGTLALGPGTPASGLKTNGALELIQVGGGQFFARELELDLSESVANGESQLVLAASGPGPNQGGQVFGLGPGAFATEAAARAIALAGAPLTLEAGTAQAFNEAFCKPIGRPDAFAPGETFGTVNFAAQAE